MGPIMYAHTVSWKSGYRYIVTNRDLPPRVVDTLTNGSRQMYRYGTPVPDFARKIRTAQNASSDYECRFLQFSGQRVLHGRYGWYDTQGKPQVQVASGIEYPFQVPTTPTTAHAVVPLAAARATENAWSQVHAMRTQVLALPAIVELGALSLRIRREAYQISAKVSAFSLRAERAIRRAERLLERKRDYSVRRLRKDLRRIQRKLASSYLAVAFGILPMLSDWKGLIDAYEAKYSIDPLIRIVSEGVASAAGSFSCDKHRQTNVGYFHWTSSSVTSATVRYTMFYRASRLRASAVAPLGLDAQSLAQSFWEAMPWSWLIDYVTNVGDWLNSSALMHFAPDFCVKSTRVTTTVEESFSPSRPPPSATLPGYYQDCTGGTAVTTAGSYVRTSGPLPRVAARIRTLDEILSVEHVINVAAVALSNSAVRRLVSITGS